jgi:predicted choloylglycine hydrolase
LWGLNQQQSADEVSMEVKCVEPRKSGQGFSVCGKLVENVLETCCTVNDVTKIASTNSKKSPLLQ